MPVVKKRRSHHAKSARTHQIQLQQQQQLQAKQRFENSRLRPEHMSTVAHDESDTISYRSYLLKQYVKSADLIDALTTQLVPLDRIKPPLVYPTATLTEMEQRLEAEKNSLTHMRELASGYEWTLSEQSQFLKDKLRLSEQELEEPDIILNEYKTKFGLSSQDNRIVIHKNKFLDLKGDSAEAPRDYWQNHAQVKQEHADRQRKKQLEAEQEVKRRLQEEQELKRRLEEEETRKKALAEQQQQEQQQKEREQQELQEQQQREQEAERQQAQQSQEQANQEQASEESQHQQTSNPHMMDSIFEEFGNEPFNNGFEDDFGDIDTAFF